LSIVIAKLDQRARWLFRVPKQGGQAPEPGASKVIKMLYHIVTEKGKHRPPQIFFQPRQQSHSFFPPLPPTISNPRQLPLSPVCLWTPANRHVNQLQNKSSIFFRQGKQKKEMQQKKNITPPYITREIILKRRIYYETYSAGENYTVKSMSLKLYFMFWQPLEASSDYGLSARPPPR